MSSGQSNPTHEEVTGKKTRKPYTITKSRESWTDEEHDKFLEALHLFDRDWKKIEDFVGSKTVIQIRSHAQKYFLKVQKNGTVAHVPPPRPKRKATHPYPQKSPINGAPQSAVHYSASSNAISTGYPAWNEASIMMNTSSSRIMPSQDDYNLNIQEDNGSKVFPRITGKGLSESRSSSRLMPEAVSSTHEKGPMLHGLPDFAEVYSFIGSVFDPGTQGHGQKLKEMDPINFETVLLLMQNLTLNLTSSDFEPIKNVLSSYDVATKSVTHSASEVVKYKATDVSC